MKMSVFLRKGLLYFALLASLLFAFGIPALQASVHQEITNQEPSFNLEKGWGTPLKPYPNRPADDLDRQILAEMDKYGVVGLSALFVKEGSIVWAEGYGWSDLDKEKQAAADTIYRVASISKTVGATALMQLWEQGKFALDDDIGEYLGYSVRNPAYPDAKITFRMLLTHTSGLRDGNSGGGYLQALNLREKPLLKDLLVPGGSHYSASTWNNYKPGSGFEYSNFGSGIVACLVEVISGEHFDQYCLRHIFRPLGMDAGFYAADLANIQDLAVLYRPGGDGQGFVASYDNYQGRKITGQKTYELPPGNGYAGPAGGMRVSVTDLAKFMIAHMNGGTYNGCRLLQRETVDLMHQMHWFGEGYDGFYKQKGLGFHITDGLAGRRLTGHAGSGYGLISDMYFDRDENVGVIFVCNGGNYLPQGNGFCDIENSVINLLMKRFAGSEKVGTRTIILKSEGKMEVNGRTIILPVNSESRGEEIFVPAISLGDALQLGIGLDEKNNILHLSTNGITISAGPGKPFIEVNGLTVPCETELYCKDNQIMVPLKMMSQELGVPIIIKQ